MHTSVEHGIIQVIMPVYYVAQKRLKFCPDYSPGSTRSGCPTSVQVVFTGSDALHLTLTITLV